jgi:16S rRNA (guanine966-N2)-methyltransferase
MTRPKGLRVISGSARGRKLVTPPGDRVRPTKDMVREAMFSALDARDALVDARVLDLFAGSGALGIEALSRGAAHVEFVECDRRALEAIATNLRTLRLDERAHVSSVDATRMLRSGASHGGPFDLVFIDPPYETTDAAVTALLVDLDAPTWLAPDAIVTIERPVRHPIVVPPGWHTGWERAFGDTLLSFCWK